MHSLLSQDDFYKILAQIGDTDRILASLGAFLVVSLIGFIVGPVYGSANPWLWIVLDRLLGFARKSYKVERTASSLAFRGAVFGLLYILVAAGIVCGFEYILKYRYPNLGIEILFLSFTMTGGAVWVAITKLYQALKEGSKLEKGSYRPIAVSTRNNLNSTDDYGITRVGIAYMPRSFDKGLVAPLFWYLIGGLPAAYLYAGIACAAWALSKEGFAKSFGSFLLSLEKFFSILPNVISGLFMMLAAIFTPTARITRVFPLFFTSKGRAKFAEGGFPLTVVAYALNISLGGPVEDLEGSVLKHSWIGPKDATARLGKVHLKRAVYMSVMAYILVFAVLVGGLFLSKLSEMGANFL